MAGEYACLLHGNRATAALEQVGDVGRVYLLPVNHGGKALARPNDSDRAVLVGLHLSAERLANQFALALRLGSLEENPRHGVDGRAQNLVFHRLLHVLHAGEKFFCPAQIRTHAKHQIAFDSVQ